MSADVQRLLELLGPRGVITEAADLAPFLTGPRRFAGECLCVVRPANTREVAAVVKFARERGLPIVPQGGNTGLCDGAVPIDPRAIVLSLSRMNAIREVDPLSYTMTVEAGVVLAQAQQAAAAHDMLMPLSLGAEGSCQIGGNIATNAGGKSALRYGTARDLVLGLEVVLPDGQVWNGLRALRKDNTGGDLRQLFIGSEGRFGVITAAVLSLRPSVAVSACAFAAVADPKGALNLMDYLRRRTGDAISSFEIINAYALETFVKHVPGGVYPLSRPAGWTVLVEASSSRADGNVGHAMSVALEESLERGLISDATIAQNAAQGAAFWKLRDEGATLFWKEGSFLLHDPCVPLGRVSDFIARVETDVEHAMSGSRVAAFGHIGDGNIHVCVSQPKAMEKRAFLAQKPAIQDAVYGAAVALGGTFSAEHGIGRIKIDELARYRPQIDLDLMTRLKQAIDPDGIMNPGKVMRPLLAAQ